MKYEFLDYVEDILDAMEKAELLVQDIEWQVVVKDIPAIKPKIQQILKDYRE